MLHFGDDDAAAADVAAIKAAAAIATADAAAADAPVDPNDRSVRRRM